jgi:hypothetical protein
MKQKNPNMRTRAWGPPMWFALTCIAMGYPEKHPTSQQRRAYKMFFYLLAYVLPCGLCRDSYREFVKELKLDSKVMSSRRNLVFWLFKMHNKVNKKLKCETLDHHQMERKYKFFDTFRAKTCNKSLAGCTKPANRNVIPKRTKVITVVDEEALMDL